MANQSEPHRLLGPGDTAPDFELPALHCEGAVSLADYRGRTPLGQAGPELDRVDGFELAEPKLGVNTGHFLIDRDGVIRWTSVECEKGRLADLGHMPSDEELLAAAQRLTP